MGIDLMRANKEMDGFKQPATMDEILEHKLAPVLEAINEHVEKIYNDFNMALHRQLQNMERVEHDISYMVQVLWGTVNQAKVEMTALQRVLVKNGLSQKDLEKEIELVHQELMETGEWKDVSLNNVAQKIGVELPNGEPPAPKNPAPPR